MLVHINPILFLHKILYLQRAQKINKNRSERKNRLNYNMDTEVFSIFVRVFLRTINCNKKAYTENNDRHEGK